MIRRSLALAVILIIARSAWAGSSDYVVLVGVGPEDPYAKAAERLADHHGTKHILRFDPEKPQGVVSALKRIGPANVAIVLRPEQIHVNTVRRILRMSTTLDDDPFPDFAYGYITGATAKEAVAFVERIVKAAGRKQPLRVARASVWGGEQPCQEGEGTYELGTIKLPERWLRFSAPDGEHGRDEKFITKHLPSLKGSGAIMLGGHGMPWEIGSGPRAEDVAKLDLFPAVAFNYACHTRVTKIWPDRKFKGSGYLTRLGEVEAKRSFALSMIRAGVTGYVAYVNPRPAGPEMTVDFERTLTGATLGEVRRNDYNKIALGYLGFDEPGIIPPEYVDGETVPRSKMDPVRNMMLDGATGGILYGDPAFRPFPVKDGVLPLSTSVRQVGEELHITLRMAGRSAYLWCSDPFRRFGERDMALKLYGRVVVPEGLPEIRSVRVQSATWAGRPIETLDPVWALETDQGKRYLHVKPGFRRGGRGDVEITVVAGPKGTPPSVGKTKDLRTLAVEAGEAILTKLDSIEKPEAYDGAAGVALFLFELAGATGEDRWLEPAEKLLARASKLMEPPGLYTGASGVGQVFLDAHRITKDEAYLREAEQIAARLAEPEGTDVIFGASGTGFFLLNLHAATGKKKHLRAAVELGKFLEKHAVRDEGEARWPTSVKLRRFYVGFSHGAAGVGTFLLALGRATGDDRWTKLAEEAAAYVMACAAEDGPDGWKWTKQDPPKKDYYPVQWCHGSPGIGLFFLALADATGRPEYEAALARCVASNRRNGRTARATGCQCHGVSGNAELFLEVWRSRKDPELLDTARAFAKDLVGPESLKLRIGEHEYGPGYMTGLAGIGRYLLRLADPENVPMAFMIAPGAPDPMLEKVRAVNKIALQPGAASDRAVAGISDLGAGGFRAVCGLIASGEAHWRTHELLRATYYPGAEKLLIRLADGPRLPGYGRWTALSGLCVADTPEVRAYLLQRLEKERDAGLFMSAAQALGRLREPRAIEPVARQLLKFEDRWSGVEPHLVASLALIGEGSMPWFVKFLEDERATNEVCVGRALSEIARHDPNKGKAAARKLAKTPRYADWGERLKGEIDRIAR